VLALWGLTLLVAPIVSRILAMAVSRKREYLADATGAQFTRNPLALATALEKLEAASAPTRSITRGAAHLCIVDPAPGLLASREGFFADTLASHPPIRQRIARLRAMGYAGAEPVKSVVGHRS
jgi:heat shock protein HtpX